MKAKNAKNTKRSPLPPALTPLRIHATGISIDSVQRDRVRERMGKRLGRFGPAIERATVRFEDAGGPQGARETLCRVKVYFGDKPSLVIDEKSGSVKDAFDRAANVTARSVKRILDRSAKEAKAQEPDRRPERIELMPRGAPRNPLGVEGAVIGRRVGRGQENLERAAERPEKRTRARPVDTAKPGRSATDRKAGGGSTARRNTKLNTAGMTSLLEDSASGRPSRKSTRRSADRTKRDANLEQRETRRTSSPKSRARGAAASEKKVRGKA